MLATPVLDGTHHRFNLNFKIFPRLNMLNTVHVFAAKLVLFICQCNSPISHTFQIPKLSKAAVENRDLVL